MTIRLRWYGFITAKRMRKPEANYARLRSLLVNPELFDPAKFDGQGRDYLHSNSKLLFDLLWGGVVSPLAGTAAIAGAAAVRLVDHEQPIFRQERLGLHANPFTILKLRTMPGVHEQTDSNGRYNDDRRSEMGKVLSLLRIDEAPQLINVAKREMAVIGPRPLMDLQFVNARRLVGVRKADEWAQVHALALPGIFDEYSNLHHRRQVEGDDAQQLATRIDVEMKYIGLTQKLYTVSSTAQ